MHHEKTALGTIFFKEKLYAGRQCTCGSVARNSSSGVSENFMRPELSFLLILVLHKSPESTLIFS